jgi:hypothetical protein
MRGLRSRESIHRSPGRYCCYNLFHPIRLATISDLAGKKLRATLLSADSLCETLIVSIGAPLAGLVAESAGVATTVRDARISPRSRQRAQTTNALLTAALYCVAVAMAVCRDRCAGLADQPSVSRRESSVQAGMHAQPITVRYG